MMRPESGCAIIVFEMLHDPNRQGDIELFREVETIDEEVGPDEPRFKTESSEAFARQVEGARSIIQQGDIRSRLRQQDRYVAPPAAQFDRPQTTQRSEGRSQSLSQCRPSRTFPLPKQDIVILANIRRVAPETFPDLSASVYVVA